MGLDLQLPPASTKPRTRPESSSDHHNSRHSLHPSRSSTMGSGPSSPTSTAAESYKDQTATESAYGKSGVGLLRRDGDSVAEVGGVPGEINETGHIQEVERNFSLLSVCSVGIVVGSTWPAFGGSIAVAISNGGPPGVIYEFIVVSIFYWLIAASLAELASSMPSSAGVYHWASITAGPKWGRPCGWFAGWWNFFAWVFASASISSIVANIGVAMYQVNHPTFVSQSWHVFVAYLITSWLCCGTVLFMNRALPTINNLGLFFILAGVVITTVVCAALPGSSPSHPPHATSSFVWAEFVNSTGWDSSGFVFLAGMLNGAFAVGTPDCVSHLAEEIPNPRRNIPLAIAAQMVIGFVTAFCYMVAIFYAINNLEAVTDLDSEFARFPLAAIYAQATNSSAGTLGLLAILLFPLLGTCVGTYITAGRTLWTLARDDATPFPRRLGKIKRGPNFKNPFNATVACGVMNTCLGCIYVGSTTAFNAFVGSFVILSSLSYCAAIMPFIFTGRFSRSGEEGGNGMRRGPYAMGHVSGLLVNIISCVYILVFVVIYCFPFLRPVTAGSMNYASLTTGGLTIFIFIWWLVRGGRYIGPKAMVHQNNEGESHGQTIEMHGESKGKGDAYHRGSTDA